MNQPPRCVVCALVLFDPVINLEEETRRFGSFWSVNQDRITIYLDKACFLGAGKYLLITFNYNPPPSVLNSIQSNTVSPLCLRGWKPSRAHRT